MLEPTLSEPLQASDALLPVMDTPDQVIAAARKEWPQAALLRAIELTREANSKGDLTALAQALHAQGTAHLIMSELDSALSCAALSLQMAELANCAGAAGRAKILRGHTLSRRWAVGEALTSCMDGLRDAEQANDQWSVARGNSALSDIFARMTLYSDSIRHDQLAIAAARAAGDTFTERAAQCDWAASRAQQRMAEAERGARLSRNSVAVEIRDLEHAIATMQEERAGFNRCFVINTLAELLVACGEPEAAHGYHLAIRTLAERLSINNYLSYALTDLALYERLHQRFEAAEALAQKALSVAITHRVLSGTLYALDCLISLAEQQDDYPRANRLLHQRARTMGQQSQEQHEALRSIYATATRLEHKEKELAQAQKKWITVPTVADLHASVSAAAIAAETCATTGLLNRLGLQSAFERLQHAVPRLNWVLGLADIDRFTQINDARGHAEGDRALALVARTLQNHLPSADIVGRHGADKFVFFVQVRDLAQATIVAESLRGAIAITTYEFAAEGVPVTLTISLQPIEKNTSFDHNLDRAYRRLADGKIHGRNRVIE